MNGKLRVVTPGKFIQLQGQSLITGTCYSLETLRCQLCGTQYQAELPQAVKQQGRYTPSCRAALAVGHYAFGMPFKRIETWQKLQGVPFADATQYDRIAELYEIALPVYQQLCQCAAEAEEFSYDDTPHRILFPTLATTRCVRTTAVIAKLGAHKIHLFYTGHRYAGENMGALLNSRESCEIWLSMSDASRMNLPKDMSAEHYALWIMCFCLVHGRRNFYDLRDTFSLESNFCLEQIGKVYAHEAYCEEQQLTAQARLHYHQQYSAPVMSGLKNWLNNQLLFRRVEPNSALGKAILYLLRHWVLLTRFLHCAGASIDNNACERIIKVVIRYLDASKFYKNDRGAAVGDALTSLICTCMKNGINPMDYLITLQLHKAAVAADPGCWLPYHYRETVAQLRAPPVEQAA